MSLRLAYMSKSQSSRHPVHGFSLLELLVVLGILSLLAGLASSGSKGIRNWLAAQESEALFLEIKNACHRYRLDHGRWPGTFMEGETGLNASGGTWREQLSGYMERQVIDRIVEDGYGNSRLFLLMDTDGDHWINREQFESVEGAGLPDKIWARIAIYSLDASGNLISKSWSDEG